MRFAKESEVQNMGFFAGGRHRIAVIVSWQEAPQIRTFVWESRGTSSPLEMGSLHGPPTDLKPNSLATQQGPNAEASGTVQAPCTFER